MNRADFMKNLAELLADMAPAEREEAIQYYNDYFDDAGEENEQSVIDSLGTPEQLAGTIKAGLFDGGSAGEFTEKGFSGYEQRQNDEVMNIDRTADGYREDGQQNGQSGENGQQFTRENGYGYRPNREENSSYRNNSYENAGYGNASYGNIGYGNEGYGNEGQHQDTKAGKSKMSGGMIALIVILCIFASPFIFGIGTGAIGVIVGLLGSLIGIFAAFAAVAVALLVVGVVLFIFGIVMLFEMPLGGLCMMGAAMICLAVGLCFLCLTVAICGALIPAFIRGVVKLVQRIFHIGGAKA